jgi:hypothetical protein
MDRQYIEDNQVIERYLQGKLTPAEEEAFEEAYLADPKLLVELRLAERLAEGLRDLDAGEHASPPHSAKWFDWVGTPRYGVAASLVAALAVAGASLLFLQNRELRGTGPSAAPTRLLPLLAVRGDAVNVIDNPAGAEWTVLLLDPGFTPYDRYRAVLVQRNAAATEERLRLDDMVPTYEGMLALGVPGELLGPGDYEVQLAGRMLGWPAERSDDLGRIPFTVAARQ